jgi:hypothetical protein
VVVGLRLSGIIAAGIARGIPYEVADGKTLAPPTDL